MAASTGVLFPSLHEDSEYRKIVECRNSVINDLNDDRVCAAALLSVGVHVKSPLVEWIAAPRGASSRLYVSVFRRNVSVVGAHHEAQRASGFDRFVCNRRERRRVVHFVHDDR
jgi:hypothetical protein